MGNELVIAHPIDDTPLRLSLLLFGGPLLYLLVQTGYLWAVTRTPSRLRPVGMVALGAAAGVALFLTAFASLLLVAAILTALVAAVLTENRARPPSGEGA